MQVFIGREVDVMWSIWLAFYRCKVSACEVNARKLSACEVEPLHPAYLAKFLVMKIMKCVKYVRRGTKITEKKFFDILTSSPTTAMPMPKTREQTMRPSMLEPSWLIIIQLFRHWRFYLIRKGVCLRANLQLSLMITGEDRNICLTLDGSCLTHKHWTRLNMLVCAKPSRLFSLSINEK